MILIDPNNELANIIYNEFFLGEHGQWYDSSLCHCGFSVEFDAKHIAEVIKAAIND